LQQEEVSKAKQSNEALQKDLHCTSVAAIQTQEKNAALVMKE
jgi:hypothetical protein